MNYKKLVVFVVIALGLYGGHKVFSKKDNNFKIKQIISGRPFEPLFETRPLQTAEEIETREALDQKYTYFGCGGQSYIFFSEDGKYALKFFKQAHFEPPTYLNYIPFIDGYRKKKQSKRRKRLLHDYGSYKLAFEHLPQETELVYVHLNKTDHLQRKIQVVDSLGKQYEIDADKTDFVLQRKGMLVHSKINNQMAANDVEGAKKTIDLVIDLIKARCLKGIRDRDPNIATNCGIYGDHAFKIDVGRFADDKLFKNPAIYRAEIFALTRPFRAWLSEKHPQLVPYLDERIIKVVAHE